MALQNVTLNHFLQMRDRWTAFRIAFVVMFRISIIYLYMNFQNYIYYIFNFPKRGGLSQKSLGFFIRQLHSLSRLGVDLKYIIF